MAELKHSIIKPTDYKIEETDGNTMVFEVKPLEPGFGVTLGNALRRTLLSSLRGAAVTAVRIEGVDHEFATVPGVLEDVPEMILNIKKLVVRYAGHDDRKRLKLTAVGPGPVTADMITAPDDIEIVNKGLVICNLGKKAKLEIEFYIGVGHGYVSAEENRFQDMPIGVVAIDSIFSPVQRVTYKVEKSRVGSHTEYDRMLLSVETNGAVTPDQALCYAARILQDQLQIFVTTTDVQEEVRIEDRGLPFDPKLLIKIESLEMSVRPRNCLGALNICYVGDLVTKTENEMMQTPNFGRKSLNEIKAVLESMGLRLGMEVEGWPPENVEELSQQYEEQLN
ncbi:MAG: DNA-directed RNA polymerase subunit alpha [Proteobacteria bacterium]|nr:DNA-directed RNA polymerase subunit alpha [Pseudomonadota bacterium]